MRRKRRVELHIEHREPSIFADAPRVSRETADFRSSDATGFLQFRHAACPTCGSPELQKLTAAATNFRVTWPLSTKQARRQHPLSPLPLRRVVNMHPNRSTNAEVIP